MAEKIEINFLGTGSAKPSKLRSHPAVLISYGSKNLLFDCGEGTQRQFRIAGMSICKITDLILSHWHGDHTYGVPGLLSTLMMDEYSKKLSIYGPKGTKEKIKLLEKIYGKFKINYEVKEIPKGKFIDQEDFYVESSKAFHIVDTNSYSFILKDKLRIDRNKIKDLPNSPLLKELQKGKDITIDGKKIKSKDVTYLEKGKKITIIMDTGFHKDLIKTAKNADILICESTFSSDEKERAKEYKHMTATDAATIAKNAKVKQLYLVHLSARHELNPQKILSEAKKTFKNTTVVKDFDKIIL